MEILLIRHGETKGNREKRFLGGRSDESLWGAGIEVLKSRSYPVVDTVFTSPMKRCMETAQHIFTQPELTTIEEFRECYFGIMEGKNHEELKTDEHYLAFLNQKDADTFPGGESMWDFSERCMKGFEKVLSISEAKGFEKVACTIHGGTIMAIMDRIILDSKNYYDWNVGNGDGYLVSVAMDSWKRGNHYAAVIAGVDNRIYT